MKKMYFKPEMEIKGIHMESMLLAGTDDFPVEPQNGGVDIYDALGKGGSFEDEEGLSDWDNL